MDISTETILKKVSRSLYLSIRVLPSGMRSAFSAAYLLCRAADSIADTQVLPRERRTQWIDMFPELLGNKTLRRKALSELTVDVAAAQRFHWERELVSNLGKCFEMFDALPAADKKAVAEVVEQVCLGMRLDLNNFPGENEKTLHALKTRADFEKYCSYIGGAPGVFWTKIMMAHGACKTATAKLEQKGAGIGEALQATNILRDIASDMQIGRCYMPEEDLLPLKLSPADLLAPETLGRLKPVLSAWIKWTVGRLDSAQEYFASIPKTQVGLRAATAWPVYWCLDTLAEVARSKKLLVPGNKTRIPRSRIYFTIFKTPTILLSDSAFSKGYRLRRETLLSLV